MKISAFVFLLVLTMGNASQAQTGAAAADATQSSAAAPRMTTTETLKGIETADLDRSIKPCDDFYGFSNGAWRAQNPIPASMDRWSRRWKAGEDNKDQLRTILDEVSAQSDHPKGSPAQLTGDFYAACTNVKAIDAAGIEPLRPYLTRIDAVHDSAGLQQEIRELHAIGIMVPFGFYGLQNPHSPNNVIADVDLACRTETTTSRPNGALWMHARSTWSTLRGSLL